VCDGGFGGGDGGCGGCDGDGGAGGGLCGCVSAVGGVAGTDGVTEASAVSAAGGWGAVFAAWACRDWCAFGFACAGCCTASTCVGTLCRRGASLVSGAGSYGSVAGTTRTAVRFGTSAARHAYPDATPQETRSASCRPRPNLRTRRSISVASDGLARDLGRRIDDEAVLACALGGVERFIGSAEKLV
jgi:hypothetical protein